MEQSNKCTEKSLKSNVLPYITENLNGIGGVIKDDHSHFVVEEVPLYEPCGEGEHVYITITRDGFTTREIQQRLARIFGIPVRDVGCAGLKDKHARVTQAFSLNIKNNNYSQIASFIQESMPVSVLSVKRHTNKLKPGHLLGNKFSILLMHPEPEIALLQARAIANELYNHGIPNYYGTQRFGIRGDNAQRGYEIIAKNKQCDRWLMRFLLSSYQSYLFNHWLAERIRRGIFEKIIEGDIAKKSTTGGLFFVTNLHIENDRFNNGEITYTGPIYGTRMMWADKEAGKLEQDIIAEEGVTPEMLNSARLLGSRRVARLLLNEIDIQLDKSGLLFKFTLSKGAYATSVLREFMKED